MTVSNITFGCDCAGVPYGSMNDLYDINYEYEFGDIQAREEVLITKTPQFLSEPLELVSDTETDTAEQISSRTISRYYTIFRFNVMLGL